MSPNISTKRSFSDASYIDVLCHVALYITIYEMLQIKLSFMFLLQSDVSSSITKCNLFNMREKPFL